MAIETFRQAADTYLAASGGTLSTEEQKDIVVAWVNALEPRKTPLLDMVMSNDEISQEVHQWGQSFRIDLDTALNGAESAASTSSTVDNGDILQVGMVIRVANPVAGTTDVMDDSNAENVLVTAISGNTVTHAAFTNGHADDAIVKIIGTAEALNSTHSEAPRQRGTQAFNYPQRFNAQLTADKRAQNMPTWENPTNALIRDFNEEMVKQKVLLERAIYHGDRVAGVTTGSVPSRFGGLDTFITTNVVDLGGVVLTPEDLEDILVSLWETTDEAENKKLVMSMNTALIWDTLLNPIRRADVKDDSINKVVRRYTLRTGTYDLLPMRNCPNGVIYMLDPSLIKVRPFKGLNWHVSGKDGKDHAVDNDVKAVSGDFTLEVRSEHAMAKLSGFDTNLDNYPALTA